MTNFEKWAVQRVSNQNRKFPSRKEVTAMFDKKPNPKPCTIYKNALVSNKLKKRSKVDEIGKKELDKIINAVKFGTKEDEIAEYLETHNGRYPEDDGMVTISIGKDHHIQETLNRHLMGFIRGKINGARRIQPYEERKNFIKIESEIVKALYSHEIETHMVQLGRFRLSFKLRERIDIESDIPENEMKTRLTVFKYERG